MKSLQGHLLVASPLLQDPNFSHTVVLIVQHDEQGALGLILNREMETTIDMVWHRISDVPCVSDAPLCQGGPCEGTLMALHSDVSLASPEVVPGVCFTADKESFEQLVGGDEDNRPVRFFVGHSGWSPEQLEGEIESGAWLITPAVAEHVFDEFENLWDTLRRRITLQNIYPRLRSELIPDDPTSN